ncbi:Right handed beta helix region [Seinonella peptonophila]|uniref:Right handed beta helix region n=1 Tax=Seinonella peptonophila TaxID=112248 RepID=A0A1M4TQV1_9BACL|nr:right-handed parallel beta-helix repeat-containing protein [Seinonella peptonophila]SHE46764.1 Right handed beta helix region [Seinonella peptonophila]
MSTIRVSRKLFSKNRSIQEAIDQAPAGSVIEIEPGLYKEEIHFHKYVQLVGIGDMEKVVIQGNRESTITMKTGYAVMKNITIRQSWLGQKEVVAISQGALVAEGCRIESRTSPAIKITGDEAEPIFRNCELYSKRSTAVETRGTGKILFEDCELSSDGDLAAVMVIKGNPVFRRCVFTGLESYGVYIEHRGEGLFEECNLFGFHYSPAVGILGGNPQFIRCKIHDGLESGVAIDEGRGHFEECRFFGFGEELPAVRINNRSHPQFANCVFHDCKGGAFLFEGESSGLIEDCEMYGFATAAAIFIFTKAHPQFIRCKIHDGNAEAVHSTDAGNGIFESCEMYGFNSSIVAITNQSRLDLLHCKLSNGKQHGIYVAQKSGGIIRNTDFTHFSHAAAIHVTQVADPLFVNCKILDSLVGVAVTENGRGTFEQCHLDRITEKLWMIQAGNPTIKDSTHEQVVEEEEELPENQTSFVHVLSDTLQGQLLNVIGQEKVKKQLHELFMYLDYLHDRKQMGIRTTEKPKLDALFLGPVDTGKKQIAHLYSTVLYQLGYLDHDGFVETTPNAWLQFEEDEMINRWEQFINHSSAGLIYIDEIDQLLSGIFSSNLEQQWVKLIQQYLSDQERKKILVISGTEMKTKRWFNKYPTLKNQIEHFFVFEDYSPEEMSFIFYRIAQDEDYHVDPTAQPALVKQMHKIWHYPGKQSHARRVYDYFKQVKIMHSMRCARLPKESRSKEVLTTIIEADLQLKETDHSGMLLPQDEEWADRLRRK